MRKSAFHTGEAMADLGRSSRYHRQKLDLHDYHTPRRRDLDRACFNSVKIASPRQAEDEVADVRPVLPRRRPGGRRPGVEQAPLAGAVLPPRPGAFRVDVRNSGASQDVSSLTHSHLCVDVDVDAAGTSDTDRTTENDEPHPVPPHITQAYAVDTNEFLFRNKRVRLIVVATLFILVAVIVVLSLRLSGVFNGGHGSDIERKIKSGVSPSEPPVPPVLRGTSGPTAVPPSAGPSHAPSPNPEGFPSKWPTSAPTPDPTRAPSSFPTSNPTSSVAQVLIATFISNDNVQPLSRCQGDCDSDEQCQGDLVCYQRDADDPVPTCNLGGLVPGDRSDLCIRPQDLPMVIHSHDAIDSPGPLLDRCQGDCDRDSHCSEGLVCFQRDPGEPAPGCDTGLLAPDYAGDLCVRPRDIGYYEPRLIDVEHVLDVDWAGITLARCKSDCDNDDHCYGDLICYMGDGAPGCNSDGVALNATGDVCVDPADVKYVNEIVTAEHIWDAVDQPPLLERCQGDCDNDDQCEGALVCFQRGSGDPVPGCSAIGNNLTYRGDVCVHRDYLN